ncbi:MAG: DUF3891 family protein [Nitrososphaerota archaeon]|nr:DUF3891 family protein [Nitrososphaerota archaeon]
MIVLDKDEKLLLITQLEHQEIAGQLASLWGNSQFSKPEPFRAMVVAAGNHDIGWWNSDTHPAKNPSTGLPYTFTELPVLEWLQMYRGGIDRIAELDPYEGLMVCMHGVGLRKNRYDTVPATDRKDTLSPKEKKSVRDYILSGERLQAKLRKKISVDPQYKRYSSEERIWTNYKLVQVWDRLSLHFCSDGILGGIARGILAPVPVRYGLDDIQIRLEKIAARQFSITPFPFSSSPIQLLLRARYIPKTRYHTEEDLRRAYYDAEINTLTVEIRNTN